MHVLEPLDRAPVCMHQRQPSGEGKVQAELRGLWVDLRQEAIRVEVKVELQFGLGSGFGLERRPMDRCGVWVP